MRIGITYDLRAEYLAAGYSEEQTAEFDRPDTIDAIDAALGQLGHRTDRIGSLRRLVQRLAAGDSWDLVFNIAEGLHGAARESQVPALLDAFDIPYTFSDPLVMAVALHKDVAKTLVQQAGLPTADFAVVRSRADVAQIDLPLPLFVKPAAEGTSKGISPASRITRPENLLAACEELLERFRQPVLVETYLPGREFTVGILGTGPQARVLGTLEIVLRPQAESDVYSLVNKEQCEELVEYRLVRAEADAEAAQAEAIALAVWRLLGCRDAGRVDLRSDRFGQPHFLEANPLPGLHPQHSDLPILCTKLGMTYRELIDRIVTSASARIHAGCRCTQSDRP